MKETTEYKAGSTLVNDGIEFPVTGLFGKKINLNIKPLKPGTIVRISQLVTKLQPVNESANMSQELLANGSNLKIIAGIISHAVINREFFKRWKFRYYRNLLLNGVPDMAHLYAYMGIVYRQMSAEHFFFIMALTPAMNYLKKQEKTGENTGEVKPFGERLQ